MPLPKKGLNATGSGGMVTWRFEQTPLVDSTGIHIVLANTGFKAFVGARALFEAILPYVQLEQPDDAPIIDHGLGKIRSIVELERSSWSNSIKFAVVRRISRESHHSSLLIDDLARDFLRVVSKCASLRSARFVLHRFEWWDRLSLRLLVRIKRLSSHSPSFTCVMSALPIGRVPGQSLPERLMACRGWFFERIRAELNPEVKGTGVATWVWTNENTDDLLVDHDDGLLVLAHELSNQNYERVYAVASLLTNGDDPNWLANVWRLVAIADVNAGFTDHAYSTLGHAKRIATSISLRSYLEYLQGLIAAKRYYDLSLADRHFTQGIDTLQGQEKIDEEDRALEMGWLQNGVALVRSMQARRDAENRQQFLQESLKLELETYAQVRSKKGAAFSYLRYNLLANLTFLLEISRRFEDASHFWRRSFEHYLAYDNPSFEVAYHYRLGWLLAKAGHFEEGFSSFAKALRGTRQVHDPFYEERVCYVIAWHATLAGRHAQALLHFREGLKVAERMRMDDEFSQHLVGALTNAARMNSADTFRELCEIGKLPGPPEIRDVCKRCINQLDSNLPLESILKTELPEMVPPSPKLLAYIPSVDLEGTPSTDLNRYLVENAEGVTKGGELHQ